MSTLTGSPRHAAELRHEWGTCVSVEGIGVFNRAIFKSPIAKACGSIFDTADIGGFDGGNMLPLDGFEIGITQVGGSEVGAVEFGPGEIASDEIRVAEVGVGENSACEVAAAKVCRVEVGVGEIG